MDKESRSGIIRYIVAMLLSGTIGVMVTESHQSAANVVFFRCLFGAIALAIYCYSRGLLRNIAYTKRTLFLTIFSGVCIVYNWVLFFSAFSRSSITVTTVVYHVQPFFLALLGWLVFREKPGFGKLLCMAIAFIGIVLVSGFRSINSDFGSTYIIGILLTLVAASFYSFAAITVKYLRQVPPQVTLLVQLLAGMVAVLPLTSLTEVSATLPEWSFLVTLGVVDTCIIYVLVYSAFHKLKTSTIAILTFIYPAVAVFSDIVFYHRRPSLAQAFGVALILLANFGSVQKWAVLLTCIRSHNSQSVSCEDMNASKAVYAGSESRVGERS